MPLFFPARFGVIIGNSTEQAISREVYNTTHEDMKEKKLEEKNEKKHTKQILKNAALRRCRQNRDVGK